MAAPFVWVGHLRPYRDGEGAANSSLHNLNSEWDIPELGARTRYRRVEEINGLSILRDAKRETDRRFTVIVKSANLGM